MNVETSLRLDHSLTPDLDSGDKTVTIRYGKRYFAPEIEIAGRRVTVNDVAHSELQDIPFTVLYSDGFCTFREAVEGMRRFYPDLTPESMMTVVCFSLLPNQLVEE